MSDPLHILILAPAGRDAEALQRVLAAQGMDCRVVASLQVLAEELEPATGAVLVTEEALAAPGTGLQQLAEALDAAPAWSDPPFVILSPPGRGRGHPASWPERLPARMTNVVFLERPVGTLSLVSALRISLRSRERQFEIRDALAELELSRAMLEARVVARTRELALVNSRLQREAAERERAEQALVQAQKMEAVGRLTGGIAHDFNNLLMAIQTSVALAGRKLDADHPADRHLQNARAAVGRGTALTAQLMAFSRIQKLQLLPVAVDAVLGNALDLFRHALGPGAEIGLEPGAPDCMALSDATQLELAVLNLLTNARDAMPEGGRIVIRTGRCQLDEPRHGAPAGAYLEVAVLDEGRGMAPEIMSRVFDPFFTTKEIGKGTGLGLAQVYGFARQCGGVVYLESAAGHGTTVRILLREVEVAAATREQVERTASPDGITGKARILLVDDDEAVRVPLAEGLREQGFVVREGSSGTHALSLLQEELPDVLVVDYAMPGMNGAETARQAQVLRPELPVVFITGYSDTAALDRISNASVLRKPFTLEELARLC